MPILLAQDTLNLFTDGWFDEQELRDPNFALFTRGWFGSKPLRNAPFNLL